MIEDTVTVYACCVILCFKSWMKSRANGGVLTVWRRCQT